MTRKRFKPKRHCTDGNCYSLVLDKPNHRFVLMLHSWEDCKDVCEFLNELHEEIEYLKPENEQLKNILYFLKNDNAKDILDVLNSQQNKIWKLKQENERLKRRNKKLEKHLQRFYSDEEWKLKEMLGDFE